MTREDEIRREMSQLLSSPIDTPIAKKFKELEEELTRLLKDTTTGSMPPTTWGGRRNN